jgi:hypothetical protein
MRRPLHIGGRTRIAVTSALLVSIGFVLSGCGLQTGQDLAQQACSHVRLSVRDYTRSVHPGLAPASVAQLQRKSEAELRSALPLAAAANSKDGSWNSLMTTISEGATIDEAHLIPALKAQCVVADTNLNVNPSSSAGS